MLGGMAVPGCNCTGGESELPNHQAAAIGQQAALHALGHLDRRFLAGICNRFHTTPCDLQSTSEGFLMNRLFNIVIQVSRLRLKTQALNRQGRPKIAQAEADRWALLMYNQDRIVED
jgi:hypothetical protein